MTVSIGLFLQRGIWEDVRIHKEQKTTQKLVLDIIAEFQEYTNDQVN